MLAEIDHLLDGKSYEIIAIECEDQSSPAFLLMSIVGYAMKRNIKVICLSTARNIQAFRITASKLMMRLSEKLRFVPLYQCLADGFVREDDSFYARVLEEVDKQIDERDNEVFVICDTFTAFCDIINCTADAPAFMRRLQQLALQKNIEAKLVIICQSKDSVTNTILHQSDILMRIKRTGNGFAKDVTGQLCVIERSGEPPYTENIFNYHLTDRSVRVTLPGISRPEL